MKLTLKQKVISLKESFTVMDEAGEPVYEVEGKLISVGHKLTVRDMAGSEAAYIHQKFFALTPKYFIEVNEQPEAELKGHITLFKPHYTLETAQGDWDIRGDFAQHEYEMKRNGATVATVTRKWFTWGDTYLLDVPDDADALTALGVMLAIDCVDADTNSAVGNTIAEGVNKK